MGWDKASFLEKLEGHHHFPDEYTFKFIVPNSQQDALEKILPEGELSIKPSSKGKYVSVTLTARFETASEVADVYLSVHHIKGLIAL